MERVWSSLMAACSSTPAPETPTRSGAANTEGGAAVMEEDAPQSGALEEALLVARKAFVNNL